MGVGASRGVRVGMLQSPTMPAQTKPELGAHPEILTRALARARGLDDNSLTAAIAAQTLLRVRPGVYTDAVGWAAAHTEERARLAASALVAARRGGPLVFAHETAAALWGLPLYRRTVRQVHVAQTERMGRSTGPVARHRVELDAADILWLAPGIGVTSLARTTYDLLRLLPVEAALCTLDAALRRVSLTDGRVIDREAADRLLAELRGRVAAAAGRRGIRQARWLLPLSDPRSESPGETVSRLYLFEVGMPARDIQCQVPSPHGGYYEVDFDLGDAWGEFDGAAKYRDSGMTHGRSTMEILERQQARQDWIRRVTGKPVVRWTMADLESPAVLAQRLRAAGLPASAIPASV